MKNWLMSLFAIVAVVTAMALVAEGVKQGLFPTADSWLSHILTIALSAFAAALAGVLGFRIYRPQRDDVGALEAAVRESNRLHRFFIDNIDEGAFLIEHSTIMDVSNVGTEIFGYTREEMIGQSPMFVVSDRAKETVRQRVSEGNEEPYEAEGQRKDGSTFPIYIHGRELVYEGRKVRLTTVQDISERKQTEATLRKLSRAVDQNPSAVFITDTDGTIEYVNAKFTEITGYTAQEAIGKNPRILKSENNPPETYRDLWRTIQSGNEWRREIQDKRKDGRYFWAYVTIAPVKNDNDEVTHYIATHEDITRRKNAEEAARVALETAGIANRAKSELLANMSHELRTPLNAIIGFSDSINQGTFGPLGHSKYAEYVHDIHDSGVHLLQLVNDILDVSAIEAGKLVLHEEQVDAVNLVDACVRLVKHRAESGDVRLSCVVDEGLPQFCADLRRMKQVLLNLLTNAVKFTPAGGTVTLGVTMDDNGGHVFHVEDTGIGMSPSDLTKAMTQFGQADSSLTRKQEGTGLGLPLTKGLVELHGGRFEIQSKPGVGTSVQVTLPNTRDVAMA